MMMRFLFLSSIVVVLYFSACSETKPSYATPAAECFSLPNNSHLPRLTTTPDGLLLTYVSSGVERDTLYLTKPALTNHRNTHIALAEGDNWFVNWADFPSVAYAGETVQHGPKLFYHILQYSGEGSYDYDVMYGLHTGGGPLGVVQKLHADTVSAEHGFVSTAPLPDGDLQITWLDGRYTKQPGPTAGSGGAAAAGAKEVEGAGDEHGHGAGGAMTLRTKRLSDSASVELDHRVCDCCNTATVATDSLIMVAYRDRSEHEIRDIAYVIRRAGEDDWSVPRLVHADNWEISGCPVNGPALAANGQHIAIVWYTAPAAAPQINFARYDPVSDRFSAPLVLDANNPYGRVDLQLAPDGTAYASALTRNDEPESADLTLWTISPQNDVSRKILAKTSAARSAGFPKIALHKEKIFWAHTHLNAKDHRHVEVCFSSR